MINQNLGVDGFKNLIKAVQFGRKGESGFFKIIEVWRRKGLKRKNFFPTARLH